MNLNRIGLLDDEENPLVDPQSALAQYQPQQVATAPQKPQGISLLQRLGMAFIPETMGAISNAKAQQAAPVDGGYEALAEYWAKQGNPEKAKQYMALSGIGVGERFGAMFEAEDGNTYQLRKGADPVLIGRTAPKIQVANGLVLKGGEVAGELPMTKEQILAKELDEKRIEATKRGQDITANTAAAGQAIAADAASKKPALSPTMANLFSESENTLNSSNAVIASLTKALALNNKAYSGLGAKQRAIARSQLGDDEGANATIELDNLIGEQALSSLRSIFGGNPTEGERAILIDLQASVNKTPAQRKAIMDRAMAAAKARGGAASRRMQAIGDGTYGTSAYVEAGAAPGKRKVYNPKTGRIE